MSRDPEKLKQLLNELKTEYLRSLPMKIENLKNLTENKNWEQLEVEYHKLKGTGKTYGFPEISTVCQIAEDLTGKINSKKQKPLQENVFWDTIKSLEKIYQSYLIMNTFLSAQDELTTFLKSDQIKTDSGSRKFYGKDWTTYFDVVASVVLFPQTIEEVQKIVKWARIHKLALVPSGGRTGLSGAAVAAQGEVVVSFEKMNKILEFNAVDSTVVCEAGVITENLQEFATEKGLHYPVDFAARGSSQMGGNIATNAGGIKVIRYGLTRDWIVGLKVVTGAGEILDLNKGLIKNATGFDLRHLFIGSEGILGFIVEATVKLTSPPKLTQVLVLGIQNLDYLMNVFSEFRKRTTLVAFEMFSENALIKVLENTELIRPFSAISNFYVLVEIENLIGQEEQISSIFQTCFEQGWIADGVISQSEEQARSLWKLRENISESLSKYNPYKNDISVRISKIPVFMKELNKILIESYPNWEVIWFGHLGDGNLHINILRPPNMSKEFFLKECQKVDELVFTAVKNQEGSISAEHGVGLTKRPFLHYTRSQAEIKIMQDIKKILDPDGIMNPGKVL